LTKHIECWEEVVESEVAFLQGKDIGVVLVDISPIGFIVADKIKVPSIGISNFTWIDQYEYIGINEEVLKKFSEAYGLCNYFIRYDLSLPLAGINSDIYNTGLISRGYDDSRIMKIKETYGAFIFISCGQSAELGDIYVDNYSGKIVYTKGIEIKNSNKEMVLEDTLDTQNFIAAAEIAIVKAGWGSIAEALCYGTKLILIERDSVVEDKQVIEELKNRKLAASISEANLSNIDYNAIKENIANIDKKKLRAINNSVNDVVRKIIEMYE